MKIEIKNRFTDEIIHAGEFASLAAAVADAVEKKINLSGANLSGADLYATINGKTIARDSNLRNLASRILDPREGQAG